MIDPVACADVDPQIRVLAGARGQGRWSKTAYRNLNNHSVVVRVDFGEASILFPGDAEREEIADLVSRYRTTGLLDVDVYLPNHHGSENGATAAYLAALTPQIAVLSVGPSGDHDAWTAYAYGHPRAGLVRSLEAAVSDARMPPQTEPVASGQYRFEPMLIDRAIYATGWDGDITLSATSAGAWTVQHQPGP